MKEEIVTNIVHKLPNRRFHKERAPSHKDEEVVRNQIDYFLINERSRNSIKSMQAFPGADVSFDYNPLTVRINLKLKKLSKPNPNRRIKTLQLLIQNTLEEFNI